MLEFPLASTRRTANGPRLSASNGLLACLLLFLMSSAQALPLRGSWHTAGPSDTAASIRNAPADSAEVDFDPARLNAIPSGVHGAWVILRPKDDATGTTS